MTWIQARLHGACALTPAKTRLDLREEEGSLGETMRHTLPRNSPLATQRVLPVALLLFGTGCGATISQPTDPHGQVQEIVTKESKKHSYFGHLAPGVTDAAQLEQQQDAEARPARDAVVDNLAATKDLRLFPLSYLRTADGQICFHKRLAIGSASERQAEADRIGKQWSFVARTHVTLDEIAPGAPWPPPVSSTVTYKEELRVAEICTPAPSVTPETQFLTVSMVSKEQSYESFLLIWDFTGKPKE
jgi:hypothetical protein